MKAKIDGFLDSFVIPFDKSDAGITLVVGGLRAKIDTLDPNMIVEQIDCSKNGINIQIKRVGYWRNLWNAITAFRARKSEQLDDFED